MSSEIQKSKDQRARDAATFRNLTGVEATHLRKVAPDEYYRLRDAAGVLPYQGPGLRIAHRVATPDAPHSDADISLMIQFPRETCEKFYKPNIQANDQNFILAKQSETARENIRNAAILHGVIVGEQRHRSVEPPAAKSDDGRVEAGSLGALAGLPATERVTVRQYNDLLAADARRLAARTPEQVAQDHVTALRLEADRVEKSLAPAKS